MWPSLYDRLMVFGIATNYPWVGGTNSANDYALANIGQVKNLFGFELGAAPDQLLTGGRITISGRRGLTPTMTQTKTA